MADIRPEESQPAWHTRSDQERKFAEKLDELVTCILSSIFLENIRCRVPIFGISEDAAMNWYHPILLYFSALFNLTMEKRIYFLLMSRCSFLS
jgi:hypothetical protein